MTKPSPKLQNLGRRYRHEQIPHAPDVEGRSGGETFQDAASPRAYDQSCGHDGPKMQGNPLGDGQRHAAEPRVHGRQESRHPAGVKPAKCSSLSFLVTHRGKDRHQTPKFAVCHGLGGRHRDWEVPSGVKLNFQRDIADSLEVCLLPWAKKHFQRVSWFLQQDSAPTHASKICQSWIQRKIPSFISKEVRPAGALTLTLWTSQSSQSWRSSPAPLPTQLWKLLGQNGGSGPLSLRKRFVPPVLAENCFSFSARLRAVVKNKGHYIE